MNVGSLFSGIGGMDHGLARAGFTHRFFCESDEWRRRVLAHHWPGVPIYEDIGDFGKPAWGAAAYRHQSPANDGWGQTGSGRPGGLDLLCGGFPCQDLSVAGQRRGLAGNRSGLFFEFARIIHALRPRFALIENVPGLLSSQGGRDFGTVLGTLADLGYGMGWRILDSRYFGVPQRRRRVFILATVADGDPRAAAERCGEILAVGTRCPGHPPQGTQTGQDVAGTLGGGAGSRGWAQDTERMTFTAFHMTQDPISGPDVPAIGRNSGGNGVLATTGVRRLTPVECERLQALPDNWTNHGPDSRRYAALGDAVTASVAEWIGHQLLAHLKVVA